MIQTDKKEKLQNKPNFKIKTLRQAKRLIILVTGLTVLLFGCLLAIPGVPGPGILVIIAGLAILGTEFVWARKLYKRFEHHATNIKNSIFNNSKKESDKVAKEQSGKD